MIFCIKGYSWLMKGKQRKKNNIPRWNFEWNSGTGDLEILHVNEKAPKPLLAQNLYMHACFKHNMKHATVTGIEQD